MLDYFFLSYKKDDSYFWNHLFCFMIIYDYIYYHLYEPTSKIRKINSRESTLLHLTTILFFITSPFILIFINSIFKYAKSQLVFMLLALDMASLYTF